MNQNMTNLIETINAMKKQECTSYQTKSGLYDQSTRIDGKCRRLIVTWFKQLRTYYQFEDCTIATAVNIMDRFVAEQPEILNSAKATVQYRLVAMACLYTAVKTHEQVALDPKAMSKLSRGVFLPRDIEEMEFHILTTLGWRLNPPTAFSFAEMYLELLPFGDENQQAMIGKLVASQINYAMEDSRFLGMAASELAFTATYNATVATTGRYSTRLEAYGNFQQMIDVKLLPFQLESELCDHILQQSNRSLFDASAVSSSLPMENKSGGKLLRRSFSNQQLSPRCITMS